MTSDRDWLPEGKRAAVCLSVDDVHPAPSAREALGHVQWLQDRHPRLRVTLFTTPDWRTRAPYPSRPFLQRLPIVRDYLFTVPVEKRGKYRLDRHRAFCEFLHDWTGAEIGLHGLHHVRRGMRPIAEFAGRSAQRCESMLTRAMMIFSEAGLPVVKGMSPPGWDAPPPLLTAMVARGLTFVASARDLSTPISASAQAAGSGLSGVSLIRPQRLPEGLVHFPTNFQATSALQRATEIVSTGGLLSIKAHILASAGTYRALDGLTVEYRDHLHDVLMSVEDKLGDELWWTSMGEIAASMQR